MSRCPSLMGWIPGCGRAGRRRARGRRAATRYKVGTNHVQRWYKAGTTPVQGGVVLSRYKVVLKPVQGGTKPTKVVQRWYKGVTKVVQAGTRARHAAIVNSSAPPAHSLCTTRHNDLAERYLGVAVVGVAVGARVAPGRVGAGVVGLSVGLSVVGVAVEGVAVLGTAVLHRTLTHLAQPWLAPR